MNKSKAAFLMTVDKLVDTFPNLYFWTFTFIKVVPDWQACELWSWFIRDVQRKYNGTVFGVKVTELHANHGLHFHCIVNRRLNVNVLRSIGVRHGFGRMQVAVVKDRQQLYYLSKYLGKSKGRWFAGAQRWHTIGGFKGVKVRDIEKVDTISEWMARIFKGHKISFADYMRFRVAIIDGNWKAVRLMKLEHMRRLAWERMYGEAKAQKRIVSDRRAEVMRRALERRKNSHKAPQKQKYSLTTLLEKPPLSSGFDSLTASWNQCDATKLARWMKGPAKC
ncbi:MAG: hypothetical protein B9S32_08845 [Verrucomicrobia bacterium Tous-C9LFEB]|nr:MAG: hypothetical protein B9S32_08845 [Verrucomicrobia bacterium Tous-C9LFEB]